MHMIDLTVQTGAVRNIEKANSLGRRLMLVGGVEKACAQFGEGNI